MTALVNLLGRAAADLAARGLWHRAWWRKDDFIGRGARDVGHDLMRARLQRRATRRVGLACLSEDNDALGAGASIGHPKYRDPALTNSGDLRHALLDFLGVEMTAGANDNILDAAGDINITSGYIGAVTTVEPAIVKEFACLGLVAEIAPRCRRSTEFEPAFLPFAAFVTRLVDDANFVVGQRLAAGDDFEWPRVVRACRLGHAFGAQPIAIDAVDKWRAAKRRKSQSHGAFGESINRRHGLRGKPIAAKSIQEPAQCLGAHWFCAIRNHAQ